MDDNALKYTLALTQIPGIGSVRGKKLITEFKNAANVFDHWQDLIRIDPRLAKIIRQASKDRELWRRTEAEMKFIEKYRLKVLFFQDAANTNQAQIIGSSSYNTVLQGTYYFPKAKVVFALDGPINYDILDAWQIEFAALTFAGSNFRTTGFYNDYSSLANGSPVKGTGGVVVE